MNLFDNEFIHISKIITVDMYTTTEEAIKKDRIAVYGDNPEVFELIFYVEGHTITNFDDTVIENKKNSLRYLPKGKISGEYKVERLSPSVCIDVYFDTSDEMPQKAFGIPDMGVLSDRFMKLYNVWDKKKPGYYSNAMSIFYDIIYTLKNNKNAYISPTAKDKLTSAYSYILDHYKEYNFDYDALCKSTGLSYSYFSELFKARYSMSPVKLVTKMKTEYAKELLITGHYDISEIAEKCGFENVYYFSNVFKKQVGVSPKNYKLLKS